MTLSFRQWFSSARQSSMSASRRHSRFNWHGSPQELKRLDEQLARWVADPDEFLRTCLEILVSRAAAGCKAFDRGRAEMRFRELVSHSRLSGKRTAARITGARLGGAKA
jgi:hypothetical protein